MMSKFWMSLKIGSLLGGLAFVFGLTSSFLASASRVDALEHLGLIDASVVSAPMTGQYYVVDTDGTIKEPLCQLRKDDFEPLEHESDGVRLVNILGAAVPGALRFVSLFVPAISATSSQQASSTAFAHEFQIINIKRNYMTVSLLLQETQTILKHRDIGQIKKTMSPQEVARELRLESCAEAIVSQLNSGLLVCQLSELVRGGSASGKLGGVDFASLCLATDTDDEPKYFPTPGSRSIWARLRRDWGLTELRSL